MAPAGGSSAALHNVLIGHGPSRVRSESIRPRYVKAGQGMTNNRQSGMNFFLSIEKRKTAILEGISSSLNTHLSERQRKGVRVKKGMVGIIRLD